MPALYRTYRPRVFAEVVGQKHITGTLQNAVTSGRVSHAYLFCGGRGVGKTSVARILARSLNCLNQKNGEACLACDICTAFDRGTFLDLVEIDAASNTGVDNIRELIEHVRFQPTSGGKKVFIIDEAHMLSKGAFNALLKTLEEPPSHVVFILATTEIAKLPATIISRTQRFDFTRLSETDMRAQLEKIAAAEKIAVPGAILSLIVRHAQGGMRDALSSLDKVIGLGSDLSTQQAEALLGVTSSETSARLFSLITTADCAGLPGFFDELVENGVDMFALNRDFLLFLRQALVMKVAGPEMHTGLLPHELAQVRKASDTVQLVDLLYCTRLFLRSQKESAQSADPGLPLLLASIEAALRFGIPTPVSVTVGTSQPAPPEIRSASTTSHTLSLAPATKEVATETIPRPPLTVDEVKLVWAEACKKIGTINKPLETLLRSVEILVTEPGTVTIGVKYLFHKEHVEATKTRDLIGSVLSEQLGRSVRVTASVIKAAPSAGDQASALGAVLQVFGGELVE